MSQWAPGTPRHEEQEREPARSQSIPGPTYDNPNDGDQTTTEPGDGAGEDDGDEEHRR